MIRIRLHIDHGTRLPGCGDVAGTLWEGWGDNPEAAMDDAGIPGDLRHLAWEAVREARLDRDGDGLVDRPSTGWWASAAGLAP